jgi:hypothetical protein
MRSTFQRALHEPSGMPYGCRRAGPGAHEGNTGEGLGFLSNGLGKLLTEANDVRTGAQDKHSTFDLGLDRAGRHLAPDRSNLLSDPPPLGLHAERDCVDGDLRRVAFAWQGLES